MFNIYYDKQLIINKHKPCKNSIQKGNLIKFQATDN